MHMLHTAGVKTFKYIMKTNHTKQPTKHGDKFLITKLQQFTDVW